MLRVSVTTVEKFRRYMAGASEWDTEQALLDTIRGLFKGTPKTAFGSAFHSILERKCKMYQSGVIVADGHYFTPEQCAPAIAYCRAHKGMAHEVPVNKIYHTTLMPIQITGRADALEGAAIRDAKTKFSAPDMHEYIDNCQWRLYLDMFEADVFYYDIFEVHGFDDMRYMPGQLNPDVVIKEVETLQCIRPEGMEQQIQELLGEFMEYLTNRNLFRYLKPALRFSNNPF